MGTSTESPREPGGHCLWSLLCSWSVLVLVVIRVLPLEPLELLRPPGINEVSDGQGWQGQKTSMVRGQRIEGTLLERDIFH